MTNPPPDALAAIIAEMRELLAWHDRYPDAPRVIADVTLNRWIEALSPPDAIRAAEPLVRIRVKTTNGQGVLTFDGQEWWHKLPDGEHALYLAPLAAEQERDRLRARWKQVPHSLRYAIDQILDAK